LRDFKIHCSRDAEVAAFHGNTGNRALVAELFTSGSHPQSSFFFVISKVISVI